MCLLWPIFSMHAPFRLASIEHNIGNLIGLSYLCVSFIAALVRLQVQPRAGAGSPIFRHLVKRSYSWRNIPSVASRPAVSLICECCGAYLY